MRVRDPDPRGRNGEVVNGRQALRSQPGGRRKVFHGTTFGSSNGTRHDRNRRPSLARRRTARVPGGSAIVAIARSRSSAAKVEHLVDFQRLDGRRKAVGGGDVRSASRASSHAFGRVLKLPEREFRVNVRLVVCVSVRSGRGGA